jgi:hypothetical protein
MDSYWEQKKAKDAEAEAEGKEDDKKEAAAEEAS